MATVIGPGASKHKCNVRVGKSVGPGGAGSVGRDMTTQRGYEARRTKNLRTMYRETSVADNRKAGR